MYGLPAHGAITSARNFVSRRGNDGGFPLSLALFREERLRARFHAACLDKRICRATRSNQRTECRPPTPVPVVRGSFHGLAR